MGQIIKAKAQWENLVHNLQLQLDKVANKKMRDWWERYIKHNTIFRGVGIPKMFGKRERPLSLSSITQNTRSINCSCWVRVPNSYREKNALRKQPWVGF